jgi:hypothetical protein
MRQFTKVVLAYFTIGAVMWGGGALKFGESGLAQFFVSNDAGHVSGSEVLGANLGNLGSGINSVINFAIGGVMLFWNLIVGFVGYLHWPIIVLSSHNAPPRVTVLVGGAFVLVFYMGLAGAVVSSS